jgi:ribosomal protein S18 acetylase RimI-like enzyme
MVPQAILDAADVGERTETWRKTLSANTHLTLAAFDDGEAAGFIHAGPPTENLVESMDGHVAALYISRSHYRRGIGRALLRRTAGWWLDRGGRSLALSVLADNVQARRFYEALGGRLVKTSTFAWHGFELLDAVYAFEDLEALAGRGA